MSENSLKLSDVDMAASIPGQMSAPILSQKQRKAAQRKDRRRRKRQAVAQARKSDVQGEAEEECIVDEEDVEDGCAEEERLRLHEEWLQRERLAQEEFRLKMEREETARKRKEEEERMIKEEWEAQQRREQEEKEQKLQERRDRELKEITFSPHNKDEAVQKMLDEAENQLEHKGPWMNPEAPVTTNSENYGTERDVANCPFFLKTGACRFGERCSRKHVYPTSSPTLMIRGMFMTFGMEELRRDDYDMDACLEHSEEDLHESFLEFYHDVLPEFKCVGKVLQFKVCCNYEPHLKGNVYIQFETDDQCKEALMKFNGRWYAGRQLQCEICPVTRWKNAICGLFDRRKCPKGKHCNFLHVFRNPGNEFWEADRDLHLSPDRNLKGSRRDGWYSERSRERSSRYSSYSRSPVRSERSRSRRENDRHRSRSREGRSPHRDKGSSRSQHRDKGADRYRSRERRRKSRSRDRRSRDRESKFKDNSEERDCGDEEPHTEATEKSRSTSRERKRKKQSRDRSLKKPDKSKRSTTDENTPSLQKRSKKRKKSKKKHKRKSPKSDSSAESNRENESDGDPVDHPSTQSPSEDIKETETTQEKCVYENNLSLETKIESEPARNGHTCE